MKRLGAIASLIVLNMSTLLYALSPVIPENVLTDEEIQRIVNNKNYFNYHSMDNTSPIWKGNNRKYSSHYLGNRVNYLSLDDVLHRVLTDGFPIQYKLEQLYRAKLGIHSSIGGILPKINFSFGEGAAPLNINNVFSGLFSFLLPSNWLRLVNQTHAYKASKYLLLRTVLDEILRAKLLYIDQHQLIQEFEILNFYFIHLQVFARMFPNENRAINTLLAEFAYEGTEMASQRGRTKLGFDDLALLMALEKVGNDYTANTINISDLDNFPQKVKDLEELEIQYRDKEKFLEEVIRNSVELKAIREFYTMSKLDVGITATGSIFSYVDRPTNPGHDARFAFRFGYDTLPNILISKSFSRTAKIDVQKEYINMLDMARRSFDFYTNSLGGYTEAKRSLQINRKAFIQNLEHIIQSSSDPDSLFILSLKTLIATELKLNNALHGSLRARAYMDRFLLVERSHALTYLPKRGEIVSFFEQVKNKKLEEARAEEEIDLILENTRKSSQLKSILYNFKNHPKLSSYTEDMVANAVRRNIGNLLYSKVSFYKRKKFYLILDQYISEQKIELTASERALLDRKKNSFWIRLTKNERVARADYYHNFDFENFPNEE